jgi:hypothetical protein
LPATAIVTPLYGKPGDLLGRKVVRIRDPWGSQDIEPVVPK